MNTTKRLVVFCLLIGISASTIGQQHKLDYTVLLSDTSAKSFSKTGNTVTLIVTNIMAGRERGLKLLKEGSPDTGSFDALKKEKTFSIRSTGNFKLQLATNKSVQINITPSTGSAANNNDGTTAQPDVTYTGIAFWDADAILKLQEAGCNKEKILTIINQYASKPKRDWPELATNPFFKKISLKNCAEITTDKEPGDLQSFSAAAALGSLSGIDVTKYVQAFADFLRDRIKEELTIAYLDKLKALINSQPEFKFLLPKTSHVFNSNDIINLPSMGATYKSAFAEDLENLVENFESMVFTLERYKPLRTNEGFTAFLVAYHYADLSAKGYHPSDVLRTLNNRFGFTTPASSKISYGLSVLNMFSQHLRDTSGKSWVIKSNLNLVNKDFMLVFFGLLYEKYEPLFRINVGANTTLETILLRGSNTVDRIYDLLVIANNIDQRIKEFKSLGAKEKQESAVAFFINNADEIIELVEFTLEITEIKIQFNEDFEKWRNIIKNSIEVAKGIRENNVGKVGINSVSVIAELLPSNDSARLIKKLTDFTRFITDMSSAETSDDIKQVLVKYAAPVRSYRVARNTRSSFTINSYPGIYFGGESNSASSKTEKTFGITAPLGMAFNWGTGPTKTSSWSLFINIVDIGAALSYRWNNDTLDLPQKIYLGQIFSPGIFGIHGFKGSPLALKFGAQYAPLLRRIKDGQNTIKDVSAVRFTIGLSVDIPVFILSHKKYN